LGKKQLLLHLSFQVHVFIPYIIMGGNGRK
jgi:hypothetical protein